MTLRSRPAAPAIRALSFAAAVGLGCLVPDGASAQIPSEFTNLQVLPEDISRAQLIGVMRGFSGGTGLRCSNCHVGEEGANNFEGYDFASDEKELKRVARAMLEMSREINGPLLAATGREDRVRVQCVTCHRGIRRPVALTDEILTTVRAEGVEAAEARYRELREEYYGRAAYDFGQGSLNMVTETLAREGDTDAALAIIALNIEHNPEDHWPHMLQAQVMAQAGDRDGAIASAERALALDPGNQFYAQQIERLKSPPQR